VRGLGVMQAVLLRGCGGDHAGDRRLLVGELDTLKAFGYFL
jgi:hypothetical protein